MSDSPFKELVQGLFKVKNQVDATLAELKQMADSINKKYEPRTQFEKWRDSIDGQYWKQKQYLHQKRCCAICNKPIPLEGSHIDHIKPISLHPELAVDIENLQIACPPCNISKGNKTKH
jgi:5-methylcytosine-specific restriction endonuclease McrA